MGSNQVMLHKNIHSFQKNSWIFGLGNILFHFKVTSQSSDHVSGFLLLEVKSSKNLRQVDNSSN